MKKRTVILLPGLLFLIMALCMSRREKIFLITDLNDYYGSSGATE